MYLETRPCKKGLGIPKDRSFGYKFDGDASSNL